MDAVKEALSRAADGVYAVDQNQCIVFWNAAAEYLLGYRAAEVEGRACQELFCGVPRSDYPAGCIACPALMAARGGAPIPTYNVLTQTKDGTELMLNVSVIVPSAADSPFAIIHLFRDITHQWRYETYVNQIRSGASRLPPPQATLGHHSSRRSTPQASLTPREQEVLSLLIQGHSLREIAEALRLSYATVRNHIQHILRKFGVHTQREVVQVALDAPLA